VPVTVRPLSSVLALVTLALAASLASAQARITATLDPGDIALGDSAELSIVITGVQSAPMLPVPPVDGLTITSLGQSVNVELVNGRASSSVTQTHQVTPARPGRFVIPPIAAQIDGKTVRTRPVQLIVRPAGAGPAAGAPRQDALMLELVLPDRPIWVGQVVTAELRLLVRDGARVSSVDPPELESSAFTVKLDPNQPRQTREQIGGAGYTAVRWPLALSAVSAGTHALTASLTVTGSVPDPSARRPRGLFDDFFGRREQSFPLRSASQDVTVLPLPDEGRPADFGGAIGEFRLAVTATPTTVTVGDPITTRVVVEGNGNFDRLTMPELTDPSGLKTYAPKTQLETTDGLGLIGKKTFEQAVVPERADLHTLPGRRLSYFDPELGRYETVTSQPIPLQVAAAPAGPTVALKPAPAEQKTPAAESFELAPNRVALGRLERDTRPLALTPWFLAAQVLPLVGLAAVFVLVRRRERLLGDLGHQQRLAAGRAVSEQMAAMDRAVASGDEAAFFTAARRAIQERVGAPPPRPAASLTLDEVERALPDASSVRGAVRDVFRTADAVAYSGARAEDLARWRAQVGELLRHLGDAG
jgi:hypothetical protein